MNDRTPGGYTLGSYSFGSMANTLLHESTLLNANCDTSRPKASELSSPRCDHCVKEFFILVLVLVGRRGVFFTVWDTLGAVFLIIGGREEDDVESLSDEPEPEEEVDSCSWSESEDIRAKLSGKYREWMAGVRGAFLAVMEGAPVFSNYLEDSCSEYEYPFLSLQKSLCICGWQRELRWIFVPCLHW